MRKKIYISSKTDADLNQLVELTGLDKTAVLEKAVDFFLRDQFLRKANEEFAQMKKDAALWACEVQERREWDITLSDGLEDEE